MAEQLFGNSTNTGTDDHNYMVVNDDGSINVDGSLSMDIPSVISTVNSTAAPLGISGVFTGTAEQLDGYGIIYVNTYSDQASAVDGLEIQQSSDGTNWDHCDEFSITAATGKNFSINPYAKWMRVLYTNGAAAQAEFRLQTILKATGRPSSHRVQDSITTDDDAELVKAVVTGQDPDGHFHNVTATHDGDLMISDNSSGLAIAQGNVTGVSHVHKFGYSPDFDTGDGQVTIWNGADDANINQMIYQYSATADIDSISSSNNSDTVDIEVQGLDTGGTVVTQTITLTGQTRSALTTSLLRVFRMKNVGTVDVVGLIYCYVNSAITNGVPDDSTQVRAVMDDGDNQTEMAVYTIPTGKTAYLRKWYASTAGAKKTTNIIVKLRTRTSGGVFQTKHRMSWAGEIPYDHDYADPEGPFAAGTDIEMTAQLTASGVTGASVAAGFDLVLVDD